MSLIPEFKIGLWNGWIFILFCFIIDVLFMANKDTVKRGSLNDFNYSKFERIFLWYVGFTVWIALILYSIFLPLKIGTLWFYIGAPLCIIGLVIQTIAHINFVSTPVNIPITEGLYKITRHPRYLGFDFIYIGASIACASWLYMIFSIIFIIIQYYSAPKEEQFCLEKYGEDYREYIKKTPRYFCFLKNVKK